MMSFGSRLRSNAWLVPACCLWAMGGLAQDLEQPAARKPGERPAYPRANSVTWYQVDPAWPHRSGDLPWGAVSGLAVDKDDNLWMFTRAKSPVRQYDANGELLRAWGDESLATPHGLRLDSEGNVWVTDVGNHVVLQFTPEGQLLKTLGTRGVPGEDASHFDKPTDVAVSPQGDIFVTDGYGNSRVVHFDREGRFVKAWGKLGVEPGQFSIPHAIVRDSQGRLYVADRNNGRIQVFREDGTFLEQWRELLVPWGLCILPNDEIWACGSSPMPWTDEQKLLSCPPKDQVIMRFNTAGKLLQLWTIPKGQDGQEKPGEVNWLHNLTFDSHGNLYVSDIVGKRVQKFLRQGR